jgi:tetratricopeptide (TPR) repeat protein
MTTVTCNYCGNNFLVNKARKSEAIEHLGNLASLALRGGNYGEAFNYFSRSIEIDPTNPNLWIGKGIAAGMLSTPANPRIDKLFFRGA